MTVFNAKWIILKKRKLYSMQVDYFEIGLTVFNAKWVILKKRKFA